MKNKLPPAIIKMYQDVWRYNYITGESYVKWLEDPVYKQAVNKVETNPIWQRELGLWREPPVKYMQDGTEQTYIIPEIRVKTASGSSGSMAVYVYRHDSNRSDHGMHLSYVCGCTQRGHSRNDKNILQATGSRNNDGNCTKAPYKGLGRELYREMIEQARQLEKEYQSDNSLSPYGFKAYQNLKPDGYDVIVNPKNTNGGSNPLGHNPNGRNNSPYESGGVVTVIPPGIHYKRIPPTNFKFQHAIIHELNLMHDEAKKVFPEHSICVQAYKDVANKLLKFLDEQELKNYNAKGSYDATKDIYRQAREAELKFITPKRKRVKKKLKK